MTLADILTFALVASLLVISPGPNGVLIAKTVPTSGRAAGFANIAGFVASFYLHGAFAVLGLSVVLMQSAVGFAVLKVLGAGYLCWIGLKSLWSAFKGEATVRDIEPAARRRTLRTAFAEGFLTNALNPKTAMFYIAAFPQFISGGAASASAAFALVAVHSAINAAWFAAMVVLLARVAAVARSGRVQRWLKGITGVVFIGFGLTLLRTRASS
ncbi:MAG: LysE family translocator [Shimia sp.]